MLKQFLNPINDFCAAVINLLYPQNCLLCNYKISDLRASAICASCRDKIDSNSSGGVERNESDKGGFAFDCLFYAATYEDLVKKCICLLKYEGKTQLADLLAKRMFDFADKHIDPAEIDLVVPVPLHPARLRQRQFNQSELLALSLAKSMNKKILKDRIKRIKYTKPQTELTRTERLQNVRGAFAVREPGYFKDKAVLLVDDVLTTGATLNECAKVLKSAGAKKIVAFALSRGN